MPTQWLVMVLNFASHLADFQQLTQATIQKAFEAGNTVPIRFWDVDRFQEVR